MATHPFGEFDTLDNGQGFGEGPHSSGQISDAFGEGYVPDGNVNDGYGDGGIELVDVTTLSSESPRIVRTSTPVHVSSLGRMGLGLVNTKLINGKK